MIPGNEAMKMYAPVSYVILQAIVVHGSRRREGLLTIWQQKEGRAADSRRREGLLTAEGGRGW